MAFANKTVTVAVSAGHILLTVDGETIDIEPAYARALARGDIHRIDHLLWDMMRAANAAGGDMTDGAAVKAFIEGRTWRW
jgi:hypothetical protein